MATPPWHSIGADRAIMRERAIIIQDADGNNVIRLGRLDGDGYGIELYDGATGLPIGYLKNADGRLVFVDASGDVRAMLGALGDGTFGVVALANDAETFRADDDGLITPASYVTLTEQSGPGSVVAVTSGSLAAVAAVRLEIGLGYKGVKGTFSVLNGSDATSTLRLRLSNATTGAELATSDTQALPIVATGYTVSFSWLHGQTIPTTVPVLLELQARRDAGANAVNVYANGLNVALVGPDGCTAAGGWEVV